MCVYLHIPTTMTFRIFMDVHYYLMDDFFSLHIIRGIFGRRKILLLGFVPHNARHYAPLEYDKHCQPGDLGLEWQVQNAL